MPIQKVTHADFQKGIVTTGAGSYELPRDQVDALYGPGWPVAPVTRPEDSELPRTLDYPVGVNYTLQPRVGYEGLMPVKALKAAYTNISEVSSPVNLIIREMSGFMAMLRDRKTKQKMKNGHPYQWMTLSPDRTVPFNVWMTRYKKSAKIYAAPAFYMGREQGAITSMEYIDGSTLFLIINSRGNLPSPQEVDEDVMKFMERIQYGLHSNDARILTSMPQLAQDFLTKQRARLQAGKPLVTTTPAYTQIIKGVPFSFWDKDQVYFIPEPPASSVDSPYGETYIERSWSWIQMIAVMTAFELAHYKTGNTPEGLMMMPKDMFPSMTKLASGEREWNARMSDTSQVQHARNRWMPEGTQYIPTKSPDFPEVLYKKAKENILAALGVPASEMGEKPGAGLGGAGFEKGAAHDVTRQILEVEKESLEDAFNYVLQKDGVDDAEFYMDYPQEEIDPSQQQEDLWNKFSHGVFTLNDVLTTQGKQPIGDPGDPENVANMHMIVAGTTMFVIEKIKPNADGIISPQGSQPNPMIPGSGGSPFGAEDEIVPKDKKGLKPDKKTIQQFAQRAEETKGKGFGKVTYSIPLEKKLAQDDAVCPDDCDPEQFEMGMKEEHEEHRSFDGSQVAQIVVDHLRQDPNYYSKGEAEGHPFRGNQWTKRLGQLSSSYIRGVVQKAQPNLAEEDVEAQFWIDPNRTIIQVDDHNESAKDILEIDREDPRYKKSGQLAEIELIEKGFIRVKYRPKSFHSPSSTNIQTAQGGQSSLRQLQNLVDEGLMTLHGEVYWEWNQSKETDDHNWVVTKPSTFMASSNVRRARGSEKEESDWVMKSHQTLVAAGLVVQAQDTGRILMLQRSLSAEDPAAGTWEFPGGHVEGEEPSDAAKREWMEETGLQLPPGIWSSTWTTADGVYQGFVYSIKSEDLLDITSERASINPDDPDGDKTESLAWWDPSQLRNNPAVRRELTLNMSSVEDALLHAPLNKHCGVCPEDAEYFGAPLVRKDNLYWMSPPDSDPQRAILKTSPGYEREEAAWLLDQSLGFQLVPLAYTNDEGAVIWYTQGEKKEMNQYSPEWVEKAKVLDYLMGIGHRDWITHPDDPQRMILINNAPGFTSQSSAEIPTPGEDIKWALSQTQGDYSMWSDIEALVGLSATQEVQERLAHILEDHAD